MGNKKYMVVIAESGKSDVKEKKKYILEHFKYKKYAEDFSRKIKKAAKQLGTFPKGYKKTGFRYRGYNIYIKSQNNYLVFYTVHEETATVTILRILRDGMDWQYIIKEWLKQNSDCSF